MGHAVGDRAVGLAVDGHHLIINYFVLGDQVVVTPTFLGAEPVHADRRQICWPASFQSRRRSRARVGRARFRTRSAPRRSSRRRLPGEDFTTAFRDNLQLNYAGIRYDDLSKPQHDLLLNLVDYHVARMRSGHAQVKMAEVKQHLKDTYFCWMGGMADDGTFYYRVQSPVIIVEFDHQRGIAFRENDQAL